MLVAAAAERAETDERLRLRAGRPRTRRRNRRLAAAVSGVVLVGGSATDGRRGRRARCRATGSTRSSAASRTPTPSSPSTGRRAAGCCSATPRPASTRSPQLSRTGGERRPGRPRPSTRSRQEAVGGSDLLVADYQATGDESSMTSVRTFTAQSMARLQAAPERGAVRTPSTSCSRRPRRSTRSSRSRRTSARAAPGPRSTEVPSVLTQSAQAAAADSWLVAPTPQRRLRLATSAPARPAGVELPHVGGNLPPASVTDPGQTAPDRSGPPCTTSSTPCSTSPAG